MKNKTKPKLNPYNYDHMILNKCQDTVIKKKKKKPFKQTLEKWNKYMQKNELGTIPHTIHKILFKTHYKLKIKAKNIFKNS